MKKIITLIAALLCLSLCLASCGRETAGADAYKLYKDAEQKTNALEKYAAEVDLELAVDFGNQSSYSMTSITKMCADIPASRFLQEFAYSTPDEDEYTVTLYHENGVTYYNDGSDRYKYAESDAAAMNSASSVAAFDFSEETLKAASTEVAEDSSAVITVKANADEFGGLCRSYLAVIEQLTALTYDFTISDVDTSVRIDADGFLRGVRLDFSATFDFLGSAATAVVSADINYTDVSGNASPAAPEGYLEYPDYDPNASTGSDTSDDEFLSDADAAAIDAAFALYNRADDGTYVRVDNYNELYSQACAEYGKDTIDSIVYMIEVFGALNAQG